MSDAGETIATEIAIGAPIQRVWIALVDLPAYAQWNPYLIRVEGKAEAGSVLTVTSQNGAMGQITQPVAVVAVEPPHQMHWEGGLPDRTLFKGDHRFVLEAEGERHTRLRHFEHFTGVQAEAILAAHRDGIRANFNRFNAALKAYCEAPQ